MQNVKNSICIRFFRSQTVMHRGPLYQCQCNLLSLNFLLSKKKYIENDRVKNILIQLFELIYINILTFLKEYWVLDLATKRIIMQ